MELLDFVGKNTFDTIGLFGVFLYVASYSALQLGRIDGNSVSYCLLNGAAASMVLVSLLFSDFNLASAMIQVVWITVSICGLCRYWRTDHVTT